ncbi:MAG: LptF/LptG family permease [Pirellulaceae bacterium]|nr:LptF/LptG family permease [Pirellulaceae bacterium]
MYRFSRYILWEVIKLFVVALVVFTAVIVLFGVMQQLLRQGLGTMAVLQLLPYVLPVSLQYAIPATLLFAVCSVYGRLSADNELLAVMAVGVPPIKFISPTLVMALAISLVAVWLNDIAYSWGKPGIKRVVTHSLEQVAYGYLRSQGAYTSDNGFSIHVHGIGADGRELILPTISHQPRSGGQPVSIEAKSARMHVDLEKEELVIELNDSVMAMGNTGPRVDKPGPFSFSIPLSDATRKATVKEPADYPMRAMPAELERQRVSLSELEEVQTARAGMALAIGKYEWLGDAFHQDCKVKTRYGTYRLHQLKMEPWRRWAAGFSCLFFVWVGIPLSMWMKSADHWTSFGICFLPTLLVYYPIFTLGLDHARDGSWSPSAVWLGNLALLLVGAYWMRRIHKAN